MKELEVTADGSCGARYDDRGFLRSWASIRLTTTLLGITYAQDVDVWDLCEAANNGPPAAHEVAFGGRRYVSRNDECQGLPKPVHDAFWGALGGLVEWMEDDGVTVADVLNWGKVAHEEARKRIQRVAKAQRSKA